jgi:hypothetical protein
VLFQNVHAPNAEGVCVQRYGEFVMGEPPFTFKIWVQNQPATTVQVWDLAELVALLATMHRDGCPERIARNGAAAGFRQAASRQALAGSVAPTQRRLTARLGQ